MGAIVWLASYPKSGNTWVRSFLANLIAGTEEPVDINSLGRFCISASSRKWFQRIAPGNADLDRPEVVARLRPKMQAALSGLASGTVLVKTHNCLGDVFGIPLHNMQVTKGAIYIVRNPLDVSVSLASHYGRSIDWVIDFMSKPAAGTRQTSEMVTEVYNSWSNHVQSWTSRPNPHLHVVRYEDMLDRPDSCFTAVARFSGLKRTEDQIERAIKNSSFETLHRQEQLGGFNEKPDSAKMFFREGKPDQWRNVLTQAQVERIVLDHRKQMARFNYVPQDF